MMKAKKINIYNKRIVLASLLLIYFTISIQSQVTIGSGLDPLKGVLLDLKESEDINGNENSEKGLMLPRVALVGITSLSPILTTSEPNYEALKPEYTGLVVYNAGTAFEKGVCVWDGTKWIPLKSAQQSGINADDGLNLSNSGTIKLGGTFDKNNVIDLNDNNLIFNSNQGKIIGIGTASPSATMQIENPNSIDPLILRNLQIMTNPNNEIDGLSGTKPVYYDLTISANGAIRKVQPHFSGNALAYNLQTDTQIAPGEDIAASGNDQGSKGSGGSWLTWTRNGSNYQYITLPETGAYVFSFNLFGSITNVQSLQTQDALSFYISAFKNGTDLANVADIAEIAVNFISSGASSPHLFASYTITLTVAGNANDQIRFKLSSYTSYSSWFKWNLLAGGDKTARRTNMVFWKL